MFQHAFTLIILLNCCNGRSIDELISAAMKSPTDDLMKDETHSFIRVDLDMVFDIGQWEIITNLNKSYSLSPSFQARPPRGSLRKANDRPRRQAIKHGVQGAKPWTNNVIPYEIDYRDFYGRGLQIIYDAMDYWMRFTCLSFIPATFNHKNKIRFIDGDGCWSHVGMLGGRQAVSLGRGCLHPGVVAHELGHVIGFFHQQSRPDRDEYIRIHYENIANHLKDSFTKLSWDRIADLGVPYDYLSIMHYGSRAFSYNGRITIETRDRSYQNLIGNRVGLSFRDIKSTNLLYNCRPISCHLRDDDCPGEGFVSKDCSCWCPSYSSDRRNPYVVCTPGGEDGDKNIDRHGIAAQDQCFDQHKDCDYWRNEGHCTSTSFGSYMATNCRRSCGLCKTSQDQCFDEHKDCDYWKNEGHCGSSSFSSYMATYCRRSCGLCQTSTDSPTLRVTTPEPLAPCEVNCHDRHAMCQTWARRGECAITSDYMLQYCRRACDVCCSSK
ncbi:zinc metalloproteinase nas-13-like [Pomacea canaliculata]|uniref:zinc metalloproteinase nas-13-like n=1 Tax=Pomacea canaliculata TaxID=400727 RepID=UPI000D7346C6|nr:zinc metalloproteinase nas-13-like [Pomacea canaliculata]